VAPAAAAVSRRITPAIDDVDEIVSDPLSAPKPAPATKPAAKPAAAGKKKDIFDDDD
jgi:hypothetical protein